MRVWVLIDVTFNHVLGIYESEKSAQKQAQICIDQLGWSAKDMQLEKMETIK